MGRGWNRSTVWRALLWGTQRRPPALWRRIPFSVEDLSSSARIHGGIRFRYSRLRCARRARSDGVREIFCRSLRCRLTGPFVICRRLGGDSFSSRKPPSRQRVPKYFHACEIGSDRCADRCRALRSIEAADQPFARARRYDIDFQRAIRDRAGLRDVLVLGLERDGLYHWRN